MRMLYVVLLVGVLVWVETSAAQSHLRTGTAAGLLTTGLTDLLTTERLLRADTGTGIDPQEEERGFNVGRVPSLAEADQKVWKLRKVDMWLSEKVWLKLGRTPTDLFKTFNLLHNTWAKIDTSMKTVQWFRFTKAYRAKYGYFTDGDIYRLLSGRVSEYKLAVVFESLKQIPDLKTMAHSMQNYQFRLWISRKETPTSVAMMLGKPRVTPWSFQSSPEDGILSSFTAFLNKLKER